MPNGDHPPLHIVCDRGCADVGQKRDRMSSNEREDGAEGGAAVEVTIVMPCLNEADTLATCIEKAERAFAASGIAGEIVVADNGSTDGSQVIAEAHRVRLLPVKVRGYGAALD